MEADFSGYATKAGLKCSDGRTITPQAFAHQDQAQVPLVWQHGHTDPENVLGHAVLEKRDDGVYAYGFFNQSKKAEHARGLLEHKDINMLSIWANDLIERGGRVLHGAIREVSLVLSGANPGAMIENVTIRHSDGATDTIEGEAIITTGEELELGEELTHGEQSEEASEESSEEKTEEGEELEHAEGDDLDEDTIADVYESLSDKQKEVVHYMIGEALEYADDKGKSDDSSEGGEVKQDNMSSDEEGDKDAEAEEVAEHDNMDSNDTPKEGTEMSNVFEKDGESSTETYELSHADIEGIVADASRKGSLKDAVEDFALSHGIDDIDVLFPDAKATSAVPEFDKRRTEWVQAVLGAASKTPFARIKTLSADLTLEDARAKGFVKGQMKREEFFGVQKRVTTPTTIYKKQKLDRDDIIDITDFDVVAWLKGEMRLMLEEELARAILVGDGRDPAHDDKISETNIRPIATDHSLFVTRVGLDFITGSPDDSEKAQALIDAVIKNRRYYKGSGMPTFFTSETIISLFLLLKDGDGRKIYSGLDEVAADLRVKAIVPVEVFDEGDIDVEDELVGIMVNLSDYTIGADAGGQVAMFDDFDIDYNTYKYLIETRVSGALTKLKSALVFHSVDAADSLVTAAAPTFVAATGVVTIPAFTDPNDHVDYFNSTADPNHESPLSTGAQTAIAAGRSVKITAEAKDGYELADPGAYVWTFTRDYD